MRVSEPLLLALEPHALSGRLDVVQPAVVAVAHDEHAYFSASEAEALDRSGGRLNRGVLSMFRPGHIHTTQ